jgi:methylmalonyl-CoA/ethylmalonyl-CoA epimerase
MIQSPLTRIHHLGICVKQLGVALDAYMAGFGLVTTSEVIQTEEIRGALVAVGPDLLEIFEPRNLEGTLGRFLQRRGEGLHHVAYQVDDIEFALAELERRGAKLIDTTPRPGLLSGWQVAFIHPSSAAGVLTELVQVTESVPQLASPRH